MLYIWTYLQKREMFSYFMNALSQPRHYSRMFLSKEYSVFLIGRCDMTSIYWGKAANVTSCVAGLGKD